MKGLLLEAEWKPRDGYKVSEFERTTGKAVTGSSVWHGPKLRIADLPDAPLGPKDVRLRVRACGICGSDVHFYETDKDGYMLYPGLTKFPAFLGHEFSGEVAEIGSEVTDLVVGDMVTAEEMIWCGECVPCRNGYPNQCLQLEEIGFTIHGAMAEHIVIGAKYCWKINELAEVYGSVDRAYEAGAVCEPTCVSYNAMFSRAGGFKPGGYVTVFGTGPIGLAGVALAKASGAGRVIAFDVSPARRELAKKLGADFAYDPVELERQGTKPRDVILEATKGEGADLHFEAAGSPPLTIPEMEASMAVGGKIVIIGRASERVPMYLENFQTRAAQLYGAQGHSGYGNFPSVIRLMAARRIDMTQIVTDRFPLDRGVEAIQKATKREGGKILVLP